MTPRRNPSRSSRQSVEDGATGGDEEKTRALSSVTKWYNEYSERLNRDSEWRRKNLQRPPAEYSLDPNYIHPVVPEAPTDNWSASDEAAVQEQWAEQKDLYAISNTLMKEYRLTWKLCIKFARCTPLDIIGVGTRFTFKSVNRDNDNKMWSAYFTRQFNCLIAQPAWTDPPFSAAGYLSAALQYTVILRTNDGSKWELAPVNPFARQFSEVIHSAAAPYNYRSLHREARKRCQDTMTPLSQLSNVFKSLEATIQDLTTPKKINTVMYEITTEDINLLTKALDHMHDSRTGHSSLSTEVFYKTAITPKPSDEPPRTDVQLARWHELAMLDQLRQIKIRERTTQVSYNFAPAGEASGSGTGPSLAFGSGAIDPADSGPAGSGPIDPSLTSKSGPAASVPALSGFSASGDGGSDAGGGLEPDLSSRSPSLDYPPEHPTATLGNFRGIFEIPESPTGSATPNVGGAELGRSPRPIRPLGSPSFRTTPTPLGGIARGAAPSLRIPILRCFGLDGRSRRIRSFASPSLASRVADQDTTMQDTFPSDNAAQHTQPPAQETSVVWTRNAPVPVGTCVLSDQRYTWTHHQVAVLPGAPDDEEEEEEDTSKLNNAASRAPGLIFK